MLRQIHGHYVNNRHFPTANANSELSVDCKRKYSYNKCILNNRIQNTGKE